MVVEPVEAATKAHFDKLSPHFKPILMLAEPVDAALAPLWNCQGAV